MNQEQKDELLWRYAKKRASFKWNLTAYFIVNLFLVGVWFVSADDYSNFWPVWPILGWGIGLAFQYFGAYHSDNIFSIEKEYERLKNNHT